MTSLPYGTIIPMPITISSLIYYPIQACRGLEVESSQVERLGLEHDRRMMVVAEGGEFLTQDEYLKLACVTPKFNNGTFTLAAPNFDSVQLPVQTNGVARPHDPWIYGKDRGLPAVHQGDEAAGWFSDWLRASVQLVHIAAAYLRKVNLEYVLRPDGHTGFVDGILTLLISEDSLNDMNTRLIEGLILMNRFRPNLVVTGCEPYAEDAWNKIKFGDVELTIVKPCSRCVVTIIDKDAL